MSTVLEPNNETKSIETAKAEPKTNIPKSPSAHEWTTTYWFLGVAFACMAITAGLEWANRPAAIKEFGRVGEEFYADFVDPTLATALEVHVFDADAVKPKEFRVERLDNGRWVIPSHHNYPADAEEQLAKTASSVIGIKRGAMVTRWAADHAHYGVVNPKQDSLSVDQVEGVGQRLILRGEDESVLADYIVGKQVDGEYDQYYVRHPNEDEVYLAKLEIDLTTKFTDWIDTDLFDVSTGEVLNLTVNDYSFDELSGKLTQSDVTALTREKTWSDDWQLESLDEDSEELNKDAIRDTLNAISSLEIAGVRAKQNGLTPELELDRSILSTQRDVDRLQSDLLSRGFLLQPGDEKDSLNLIAREGELHAGTDDGLVYRMHFGRVFTGSEEELEVGFATSSSESVEPTEDSPSDESGADASETDPSDPATEAKDEREEPESRTKPGRYVFVRVDFDQQLLGDEPTKPLEPEKPAELSEAEKTKAEAEDSEPSGAEGPEDDSQATTEAEASESDAADTEDEEQDSEESKLDELRKEYEEAKKKYDKDLRAYEDFQQKVKDGKEKAEELNRRFAEWYYVIPGESYDKLSLARADLVKTKEVDEDDEQADADSSEAKATDTAD